MNKQSGRRIFSDKSASTTTLRFPSSARQQMRRVALSFFVLLALIMLVGQANAATSATSFTNASENVVQSTVKTYRVAQMTTVSEGWQENSFREFDIQNRLDALVRDKTPQSTNNKKRRRAVKKRQMRVVLPARKTRKLKSAAKQSADKKVLMKTATTGPANQKAIKTASAIITEPVKLQRCLKTTGYFNGAITGNIDEATRRAYLAFRDDKNLQHRPNDLHDPVIQKILFSQCHDDNPSNLNKVVASAMERKLNVVSSVKKPASKKVKLKKMVAIKLPVNKTAVRSVSRQMAMEDDGPLTTASIVVTKKQQTRLPVFGGSKAAPMNESTIENHFAQDVLAATDSFDNQISASGKKDRPVRPKKARLSGASSSFAVKRVSSNKANSKGQAARLKVAKNSLPVSPKGKSAAAMKMARVYDDGPMITGAISPSSFGKAIRQKPKSKTRLVPTTASQKSCLPQDLYNLLATTAGRKVDISVCKSDCLTAPASFSQGQKRLFAEQYNISWCGTSCLGVADPMSLKEVMKIEREARVHVCTTPQTRMLPAVKKGLDSAGINAPIRALFDRMPAGNGNEKNIAVIIGNRNYSGDVMVNDAGHVNAAAMKTLLVEQLGYKKSNVIVVKDAKRSDFIRLFGKRGDASGELQRRLRANRDAQLTIYYSGHASSSGLGMDNYLWPIDTITGDESKTAYSMAVLYDNLREFDARTTRLFLETGFNANRSPAVLAPNIAERRVTIAPMVPVRGLAVFSAATGDQKPLIDHETGIGLFTRFLISGLAGAADKRPVGNGDRIVDNTELYVHVAANVRLSARKTLGLRQNPTFSRSENLFLSQLSKKTKR